MIEHIFKLLAPHCCIQCGLEGFLLCYECGSQLASAAPGCLICDACCVCPAAGVPKVFCATGYVGSAKELVRRLKFARAKAAADDMARIMAERLPDPPAGTVVTYIPTAPGRMRQRGYDQAEVVARRLAVRLNFPVCPLLQRNGSGRQTGKTRVVRLEQARILFEARAAPMPGYVLLVDDVLTTGATLRAAAGVLYGAGVRHVTAVVFAAAERFG